jgi:hypothetical protein
MSTLDNSKGTKSGHTVADRGGVEDVNDLVDVLVCVGLLLFEARPASGTGDDTPFGEFLLN